MGWLAYWFADALPVDPGQDMRIGPVGGIGQVSAEMKTRDRIVCQVLAALLLWW
jgi:hypothetical protein